MNNRTGFNCPCCKTFIEISLNQLIHLDDLKCPSCNSVISNIRNHDNPAQKFILEIESKLKIDNHS
jgi:Zn finger protein HypA/HybF involved in hydrogenase expression